ncbi:MAG: aspartate 1-decarboxylase [Micavibrio aeruginosavorus]|uniref:Aspartate 1-decarboxylase n=1 Tax=Micavibrio aeruginosavorus TaxID=349221 RepID=A0A2W5PQ05_9BACT|nr:MAG: aspartate 1-decarboxylase [Micavibrio aeruginosavorus]
MNITMLKSKIHRATVTQCDLHYEGSLTIDVALMEASGIIAHEQIDVLNINNGARFTTYAIEGKRGSGIIGVNGAAARLAQNGDMIIVCSYGSMDAVEAKTFEPTVVFVDESNLHAKAVKVSHAAAV